MELFEIEEKYQLTREEAAKVLHQIADSLERHNSLDFERNGLKINVDVPKQVELEIEVEVESESKKSSLEIEINW
ncbi:amphi-Trp domain-containing protein [Thalassotalea litorea]|uniref:Amphi-Trp domain-containing protein n=1 Tax=Thalassotalea litorea TaxID=2020715 RepID=A0A5R9ILG0_9GAMM|nr:amphi-Trp domain-containing protein [Thalassotalea litorea]TLU65303.1 amphi-Trp domain-containing protein [Thalassotalea litorea]